ncbi:MAG TPA: preprotein translocase subunit SecG [Bacteroidetes bacterium]|nr:preprotein translocase subunit SecG [Bacteroidota bacterium]
MFTVILIIALVICVILALAVLIQNPKGGGLSGTFGGTANQLFGYKRTSDDIEKITWYLGIALLVLCLGSAAFKPGTTGAQATPFEGQAIAQTKADIIIIHAKITTLDDTNTGDQAGSDDELPE